jgi:hypothetical protein
MALDLNTISFVGASIKLAWEIYDKGFKKEKSSRRWPRSSSSAEPLGQ